jgi:hypothetical protein
MDRTLIQRTIGRYILISGLTVQALTPDALDLSLLMNHRLPGPVLALLSIFAEEKEEEEEESNKGGDPEVHRGLSPYLSVEHDAPSDDPPSDLCTPLWPELGLALLLSKAPHARLVTSSIWIVLCVPSTDGHTLVGCNGGITSGRELASSLCRITC